MCYAESRDDVYLIETHTFAYKRENVIVAFMCYAVALLCGMPSTQSWLLLSSNVNNVFACVIQTQGTCNTTFECTLCEGAFLYIRVCVCYSSST